MISKNTSSDTKIYSIFSRTITVKSSEMHEGFNLQANYSIWSSNDPLAMFFF